MKNSLSLFLIITISFACRNHKNLTQTPLVSLQDSLVYHINNSAKDTETFNPKLKFLQSQNDLVIAFGSLNYAWARKGTYCVLALQNKVWKLYTYEAKLPPSAEDKAMELTPQNIPAETAEKIKKRYAASELWETEGDKDGRFCGVKKNCNINDAETWTISIATPQNTHTTTYYAPQFFEECCPGNPYRARFVAIAKEMMALNKNNSSAPEK